MAIIKNEISGSTGTSTRLTCDDCKAWAWEGQQIRHSKRCDAPIQYGHVSAAEKLPVLRAPRNAREVEDFVNSSTNDEIFDAYKRGWISQSDAMNRDM